MLLNNLLGVWNSKNQICNIIIRYEILNYDNICGTQALANANGNLKRYLDVCQIGIQL